MDVNVVQRVQKGVKFAPANGRSSSLSRVSSGAGESDREATDAAGVEPTPLKDAPPCRLPSCRARQ